MTCGRPTPHTHHRLNGAAAVFCRLGKESQAKRRKEEQKDLAQKKATRDAQQEVSSSTSTLQARSVIFTKGTKNNLTQKILARDVHQEVAILRQLEIQFVLYDRGHI